MAALKEYFRSYASHAKWANQLIYETIDQVRDGDYDRVLIPGVRSIHHLMNHVIIMDELWLSELRQDGARDDIVSGNQYLYADRAAMRQARGRVDDELIVFIDSLEDEFLTSNVEYDGSGFHWPIWLEFAHVFRHQVHHRGQFSAMVCSIGFEPPELDPMYTPPHLRQTPVMDQLARVDPEAVIIPKFWE